jgi:hypothetical protein
MRGVSGHLNMTERIILSIVTVTMLLLTIKQQGLFNKIIIIGLTIGVLITWVGLPLIILMGFSIYTLCSLLTIIYSFTQKHLLFFEKVIISLTGFIVLIGNIFAIQHWPFANQIKVIMVIPVLAYFSLLIFTKMKINKETGFMTVFAIGCLLKFISLWT